MKKLLKLFVAAFLLSTVFASCSGGGGGGGSSNTNINSNTTTQTISGMAAAGGPIVGTVTIRDSSTPPVTKTVQIAADGGYTIDVTGLTPPFALRADGMVGGLSYSLCSAAIGSDINGTINITPFTDLILSGLAGEIAANYYNTGNFSTLTPAALNAAQAALQAKLLPILEAMGLSNSIDLLRTSFSADHTGLDAVIDIVQVVINPTAASATITDIVNQEIITANFAAQTYTGTFSNSNVSQGITDIQAIENQVNTFSSLVATAITPTNPQLLALFDSATFLQDGADLSTFLSNMPMPAPSLTFTVAAINAIDSAAGTAIVTIEYTFQGRTGQYDVTGPWSFIKKNGVWLMQGDQKIVWVSVQAEAYYSMQSYAYDTGLNFNISNVPSNSNIASAVFTGPGLPTAGLTKTIMLPGYNGFSYDINLSGGALNDTLISAIASNAVYTCQLYDASSSLLATYTQMLPKRPLMLSELSTGLFPMITAPTITALNAYSGGQIQVTWTLPMDYTFYEVDLSLADNTGSNSAEVSVQWVQTGATALATALTLQPITSTGTTFTPASRYLYIMANDIYNRSFETVSSPQILYHSQ